MKHKLLGQVYTPDWIVNEILDLVGYKGKNILEKYILEPSSGDGAFLLSIIDRYIDAALENEIEKNEIISGLEKYIYAIELDKIEYNKSITNINNLIREKLKIDYDVKLNIYNDSTLNLYKNHINFFDFIVGNPPYIRIHNLDLETREQLKNEFIFSDGTIDIYLSFFEMSFKMLSKSGILGFITPNSFMRNSSYKNFRKFLKNERTLRILIDFKSFKVFKEFSTYTAITVFQNNNNNDCFEYKEYIDNQFKTLNNIKFNDLNDKDWSFTDRENEQFLMELMQDKNASIKDFFDVQYGFATLRDKIFISKVKEYDDDLVYFNDSLIEKKILQKIVKGSKFKGQLDDYEMIIFPYELVKGRYVVISEEKLRSIYPNAYKYLLKNKVELESRDIDKNAKWYEFGRSQGIQSIHNEKIIVGTLVNGKIESHRVPADIMVYSGIFIIKNSPNSKWEIVEEMLQSDDFYRYIRLTGKDFSGGYKSITSKQIKEYKITPTL